MQRFHNKNIRWTLFALGMYALLFVLVQTGVINFYYESTFINIMINIIYAVGLNLILGVAGQFSLGHAGFIAIGSYSGAILGKMMNGLPGLFAGMAVGVVISVIVAFLVGLPTLRLKGDYLAIATLGVAEIIRVAVTNMKITNGAAGISGVPLTNTWTITYIALVVTTILILNYTFSSAGRATYAVLQDEIAAESMGVQVTKYKILAFVLGAATASIGGTLSATTLGAVTPSDFTFMKSIEVLIIVVFGGIGSFTGSFVAAVLLGIINLVLQPFGQLRMIIYAVALILIMIFRPGGLLGTWEFKLGDFKFSKKKETKESGK